MGWVGGLIDVRCDGYGTCLVPGENRPVSEDYIVSEESRLYSFRRIRKVSADHLFVTEDECPNTPLTSIKTVPADNPNSKASTKIWRKLPAHVALCVVLSHMEY